MFKAPRLKRSGQAVQAAIVELDETMLPPGDVVVRVEYSTLNLIGAEFECDPAIQGSAGSCSAWPPAWRHGMSCPRWVGTVLARKRR